MSSHVVGTPLAVVEGLGELQRRTGADELMISTRTHSYETRLQSFALIAEAWGLQEYVSSPSSRDASDLVSPSHSQKTH